MHWRTVMVSTPLALVLLLGAGAAFLPIRFESPEELFAIPKGTWARRHAGDDVEILPSEIRLVVGVRNILLLRNLDDVPQIFGPTLIMPGQELRLPFDEVSENQFACTAHASGQLTVIVDELPASAWARLRWRVGALERTLSRQRWRDVRHGQAQKGPSPAPAHLSSSDRLVGRGAKDP